MDDIGRQRDPRLGQCLRDLEIGLNAAAGALAGFDPERRALAVRLTRILLPAQIFFVTGGILRAVLMAHGRFRTQAAAPLIYNICPIVVDLSARIGAR